MNTKWTQMMKTLEQFHYERLKKLKRKVKKSIKSNIASDDVVKTLLSAKDTSEFAGTRLDE